jgi:endonuclease/exonuclease/phosphatase family metal-dependent hydrolase
VAWNIQRGGSIDAQLAAFAAGQLPVPDVLLMSELDRGCSRTADRNIAWEYAEALQMNHVYGVEFVELPRPDMSITTPCEHGNAILSRYPIGNVELVRHAVNESWYEVADEPRLGGRMFLRADVLVGDRLVQVASLHFESGVEDGAKRAAQAAEVADALLEHDDPAIAGGDTNAGLYALDLSLGTHNEGTTEAFFERGFADAHIDLPLADRPTRSNGLVLDLIFVHGASASMSAVCPAEVCDPLSDHRAVWTTIALE